MPVLLLVAALLAAAFASLSNGIGVLTRQRETLIGAVSLAAAAAHVPVAALMQLSLAPGWIDTVAKFNPVDWAAAAARDPDLAAPRGRSLAARRAVGVVRDARLRRLPKLALKKSLLPSAAMATCYRHPSRETGVSCSNCGNPICPDCMTPTPVGMRCPDCARQKTPVRTLRSMAIDPIATYVLIAINVLVFFGVGTSPAAADDLSLFGAVHQDARRPRASGGGWSRPASCTRSSGTSA